MAVDPARRRKVESAGDGAAEAAVDRHERAKGFLSPAETARLLDAAKDSAPADRGQDLRLIQDDRGHRDPRHTVQYTRAAGRRFEGLWR